MYRIASIRGDRYAGEFPRQQFRKHGINCEPSEQTKSEAFSDVVAQINSGTVDLLDNAKLIGQLIGLERRTRSRPDRLCTGRT
jgi:hypothetical protein